MGCLIKYTHLNKYFLLTFNPFSPGGRIYIRPTPIRRRRIYTSGADSTTHALYCSRIAAWGGLLLYRIVYNTVAAC